MRTGPIVASLPLSLQEWQKEVHRLAKEKGWWDPTSEKEQEAEFALACLAISHLSISNHLEAVRKEAATENGFKKLVARNFGADIAKRVRVVE